MYSLFYINYVICKLYQDTTTVYAVVKFYINYVICKCLIFLAFKIISERFILTMWYVNKSIKAIGSEFSCVLY